MNVQFYNVSQIAEIFGVHPETVRRWIERGSLKAVRLGRAYLVSVRHVEGLRDAGASSV